MIEETAEAIHVVRQGKIRAIGVSNFSVGQMEPFVALRRCIAYNMFERSIETDLLPYADRIKSPRWIWALCRNLLSGRMRADTAFDGDDLRQPIRNS
jgi:aryl-alcohol dehydrogenase-like predicted oxidoreductase